MASIASIALSGMNTAALGLRVSAHNVANVSTEPFTRQELVRSEQAAGGVGAVVRNAAQGGSDLARDMVSQLELSYQFKANVLSIKAEDERLGTLLDLRA